MTKGPLCQGCPRFSELRCPPAAQDAARRCDVLIVAEQPDDKSATAGRALFGHGGTVVNKAIDAVMDSEPVYRGLDVRKTYAVQCMSPDDTAPNKEVMAQCSTYLNGLIGAWKPKVLIVLGGTAFKQLGFKLQFNDSRGKMYTHAGTGTPVLVTFSEKALVAAPGVYATFMLDLRNAFKRALYGEAKAKTIEELSKDYILPKTVDESLAVCDLICNYARSGDPAAWAISFDTETTTLRPEKSSARIIAFCFAWDAGKATTILYDHPHAPEEFSVRRAELRDAIQRVLASSKPKLAHNLKFDAKFVMLKELFTINNLMWCTLLGEHLLDEDKKGNYGLKALTASFLPDYVGYEDRLYDLLQAEEGISEAEEMAKEIADQADILAEDHPEFLAALTKHHAELVEYEQKSPAEQAALATYERAMEDYTFMRSYHKGRVAVWEAEVADWPKGKRGKPVKPKSTAAKPEKPVISKRPKRPEDPRSKKERQIAKDAGFENVPIDELQLYGAIDADVTRQLTSIQRTRIKQEQSKVGPLMRTHAVPASLVLGRMEYYGTRVDQEYIPVLEEGLRRIAESTERELYDMAGRVRNDRAINLNSPITLCDVLFSWGWTHPDGKVVTYTPVEKTKKGAFSTSEKVIRTFIEYADDAKTIPAHDALFAVRLLEWRKSSKALNTFLANIRALSKRDGFLHTQFHLNGTGTGRLSSSDMNMQNIPKFLANFNIKKLFIPESDDYVIVNVDWKGAEVRVFTAYAHDPALIDALNRGLDMHSFFAHKVFNRPYEHYDRRDDDVFLPDKAYRKKLDLERSRIKRVVFGILYGAGPGKIAETIGVSEDVARELIDLLYAMFPAIKQYAIDIEQEVLNKGWVETHFGRRRRFPLARLSRHRGRAVRQARNFKIQSTSSDIVIGQLVEMDQPLRDLGGRLLLTVHDSIVMQFPKKHLSQLKEFIHYYAEKRVREKYSWLPVPFKVDIEVGPNYGECQPIDKYLAKHVFTPVLEGVVEENEILAELRDDAFSGEAAATV